MNTIILLCGTNESGKTKTLKAFFGVNLEERLDPLQLLKRIFKGKTIFGVSLSSPQEQSEFCKIDQVKSRINKRLEKCQDESNGKDFIMIIPFGIYQKSNILEKRLCALARCQGYSN